MSEGEQDSLCESSKKDLADFLSKVDEIGDLVQGLSSSEDWSASAEAIKKADAYLQNAKKKEGPTTSSGFDRTVVNKSSASSNPSRDAETSQQEFCRSLEEDAKERAKRRREKEAVGGEWKRKGTQAFRQGDVKAAIDHYSKAITEMPWVISLYTNRALCLYKLERYEEAIKDCDVALRFEPNTLKAHVHKGKSLAGVGKYSQAVECYQNALRLSPEARIRGEIESELESAKRQFRQNGTI